MIAFVSGIVVDKGIDFAVVNNNGIGYLIYCGRTEMISVNEEALFYTYQHVREDAIILFGFLDKTELEIFKRLITVKGVGPKTGVNILARVTGDQIINAVEKEDIAFLKSLPGVGPKMAAQIMLDLKGKFVSIENQSLNTTLDAPIIEEVSEALINLGFKKQEINSIKASLKEHEDQSINGLITHGLRLLNAKKRGS